MLGLAPVALAKTEYALWAKSRRLGLSLDFDFGIGEEGANAHGKKSNSCTPGDRDSKKRRNAEKGASDASLQSGLFVFYQRGENLPTQQAGWPPKSHSYLPRLRWRILQPESGRESASVGREVSPRSEQQLWRRPATERLAHRLASWRRTEKTLGLLPVRGNPW